MTIHPEKLGASQYGKNVRWTETDVMLYGVSVGAGADGESALDFATENSLSGALQTLPTFPVILTAQSDSSPIWQVGDFPLSSVIHAGQRVTLAQPLSAAGEVSSSSSVTGIYDTGKHAIIETTTHLLDSRSQELVAETTSTALILHEGGFAGPPPPVSKWEKPERAPDGINRFQTARNQALIYRLNGDRNPLHSDPQQAKKAGFQRPILHGLCTYAISMREIIAAAFNDRAEDIVSVEARFSNPVVPGDSLYIEWWRESDIRGQSILFRTLNDSGAVVLDHGIVTARL